MRLSRKETQVARERLLDGVERLQQATDAGDDPVAAAVKVATDLKLPAGQIRLLAAAFNTGQTAGARRGGVLAEKTAEFDLVDADRVIEKLYPPELRRDSVKVSQTVVSRDYAESPSWLENLRPRTVTTKAAAVPEAAAMAEPPELAAQRLAAAQDRLRICRDEFDQHLATLRYKISEELSQFQAYFSRVGSDAYANVSANCELVYGDAAKPIFRKSAWLQSRQSASTLPQPFDASKPPYRCVAEIIKLSGQYLQTIDNVAVFEKEAVAEEMRLYHAIVKPQPLPADPALSPLRRMRGEKRALASSPVGVVAGVGAGLGESIVKRLLPTAADRLSDGVYTDLVDPDHERRLRGLRAQAVMHQLLTSPYFEGEDPRHVVELFNRVTKLSPRLVENPIALESVLRRHMSQGQADPHDLAQVLDIEQGLKNRDAIGDSRLLPIVAPSLPKPVNQGRS